MPKGFSTGINKLVGPKISSDKKQIQLYEKTWREIRTKIDSILIGNNVLKSDEVRKKCQSLDGMSLEERSLHIKDNWGSLYADRCYPLLSQLDTIEKQISTLQKG